jgi:dynein light intermediate chain 1
MATLEREYGWKDEQFDIVGQYVRTILLKHGGSLIYTMPSAPGSLQPLVHQALGISSTLTAKGGEVTYEVSNRDRTLVPMNWDSWAKIRMMADNFDPELISKAWSLDIQNIASAEDDTSASASESQNPSAVSLYESTIPNPFTSTSPASAKPTTNNGIEVFSKDVQQFLAEQSKILDDLTTSDRKDRLAQESKKSAANASLLEDGKGHVEEHIGPVQFNVGGISVDAEEMVRKIKVSILFTPLPFPFAIQVLTIA